MATAKEEKKRTALKEVPPIGKQAMQDIALEDELKKLGWRVDRLSSGLHASEMHGDGRIGPAANIKALHTQVMLKSGPPKNGNGKAAAANIADVVPEHDLAPGEQRLPTMEEPEIDELNRQADVCIAKLQERKLASTASKDADDVMREKMREFGRKRYSRHGKSFVIEESEKLVIKDETQNPPLNPSTKNGNGKKV